MNANERRESDHHRISESFDRCLREPKFLDRFYDLFLASSDEVQAKFRDTDFEHQKRMLRASLFIILMTNRFEEDGLAHLDRLGVLHGHTHQIGPELYDLWLDCLIQAVKEFDPTFDDSSEKLWRDVMRKGIEVMKSYCL